MPKSHSNRPAHEGESDAQCQGGLEKLSPLPKHATPRDQAADLMDGDGVRKEAHCLDLINAPHGDSATDETREQQPPDAFVHDLLGPARLSEQHALRLLLDRCKTHHSAALRCASDSSSVGIAAPPSSSAYDGSPSLTISCSSISRSLADAEGGVGGDGPTLLGGSLAVFVE